MSERRSRPSVELPDISVLQKFRTTAGDTPLRRWAVQVLRDFVIKDRTLVQETISSIPSIWLDAKALQISCCKYCNNCCKHGPHLEGPI